MIDTITVSSRGQIVIPEKVRKQLGIHTGSKLVLFAKQDSLILKKEEQLVKAFEHTERKEELGWMLLGEKALAKVWDNPQDEETWKKYV